MDRSLTYTHRRGQLETYFDRTAAENWARLTSEAPVSRIRQTVREGREAMQNFLLSRLPEDLRGHRVLDAGCGTGTLSIELARRGAEVVGTDISETLVSLARERAEALGWSGIRFETGDMLDPQLGSFDYIVAMDSLIHYPVPDMVNMIDQLINRCHQTLLVTFAPRTPLLTLMHWMGQLFPRSDRSPAIVPVKTGKLLRRIQDSGDGRFGPGLSYQVRRGFYISTGLEIHRWT